MRFRGMVVGLVGVLAFVLASAAAASPVGEYGGALAEVAAPGASTVDTFDPGDVDPEPPPVCIEDANGECAAATEDYFIVRCVGDGSIVHVARSDEGPGGDPEFLCAGPFDVLDP